MKLTCKNVLHSLITSYMRRCLTFVKEHPFWEKYPLWLCVVVLVVIWFVASFLITICFGAATRGLAYLLALPLVTVGLYLAYERTQSLKKQNKTDGDRLLAETFARSIELLGHRKEAVRQGAIYALGKIAEDNHSELTAIINTLCAFIRHNRLNSQLIAKQGNTSKSEEYDVSEHLPIDIDAAVRTIAKLTQSLNSEDDDKSKNKKYDLSNTHLFLADFSNAKLVDFNLSDSYFLDCIFENTNFSNSNLVSSVFHRSDFEKATFDTKTEVKSTDFSKAENLTREMLEEAEGDRKTTKLPKGMEIPVSWPSP